MSDQKGPAPTQKLSTTLKRMSISPQKKSVGGGGFRAVIPKPSNRNQITFGPMRPMNPSSGQQHHLQTQPKKSPVGLNDTDVRAYFPISVFTEAFTDKTDDVETCCEKLADGLRSQYGKHLTGNEDFFVYAMKHGYPLSEMQGKKGAVISVSVPRRLDDIVNAEEVNAIAANYDARKKRELEKRLQAMEYKIRTSSLDFLCLTCGSNMIQFDLSGYGYGRQSIACTTSYCSRGSIFGDVETIGDMNPDMLHSNKPLELWHVSFKKNLQNGLEIDSKSKTISFHGSSENQSPAWVAKGDSKSVIIMIDYKHTAQGNDRTWRDSVKKAIKKVCGPQKLIWIPKRSTDPSVDLEKLFKQDVPHAIVSNRNGCHTLVYEE